MLSAPEPRRRRTPTADCAIPQPGHDHPLPGRHRRRAVRDRAAGHCRGDRQDPHHRMDAAAPLRRTAVPRHELELVGLSRRRRGRRCAEASAGEFASPATLQAERVVFGARVRAGHLRAGQPAHRQPDAFGSDANRVDLWSLDNADDVNGGTNHFGSPFNFPEDFTTVYRLHALVPDLIEYRDFGAPERHPQQDPGRGDVPRQGDRCHAQARAGELGAVDGTAAAGPATCGIIRSSCRTCRCLACIRPRQIDVAALDLIRDRERGVPRFNEFRRQYGLRQLTSFDDFVDQRLAEDSPSAGNRNDWWRRCAKSTANTGATPRRSSPTRSSTRRQADQRLPGASRRQHGRQHRGRRHVVGFLAESTRPHGFAISETQFQVFILNASRRLFSDRFFTSSFRPEFYTSLGIDWVTNNGPTGTHGKRRTERPQARYRRSSAFCFAPSPSLSRSWST